MKAWTPALCAIALLVPSVSWACDRDDDCARGLVCIRGVCREALATPRLEELSPEPGGRPLKLTRGTLQLFGEISITPQVEVADAGNRSSSPTVAGAFVDFAPGIGVFVAKGLALQLQLDLGVGIGDLYANRAYLAGFDVGLRVYPRLGKFGALYLGASVGPTVELPRVSGASAVGYANFTVPFGLLIALNRHVAIDVGLRFALTVHPGSPTSLVLRVPLGYLGVQSFI